jgi:hypothetical protein
MGSEEFYEYGVFAEAHTGTGSQGEQKSKKRASGLERGLL